MSQYIRSRLGSVAGIVVTDFSSVVVVIVSAACVSVVFVFFIEQIVDGAPYGYRLYFRLLEGIGQIQVAYEISIQRALLLLGVTHVLLADIL